MEKTTIETIIRRFNEAGVRYLIAGEFAVIAHGYVRLTMDLDLVLDLEPQNVSKALRILQDEGYAPTFLFQSSSLRTHKIAQTGFKTEIWLPFLCGVNAIA